MTENELVGWYHQLNGHDFEQTLGDDDGQGSLVCRSMGSQRVRCDWATEQQQQAKRETIIFSYTIHKNLADFNGHSMDKQLFAWLPFSICSFLWILHEQMVYTVDSAFNNILPPTRPSVSCGYFSKHISSYPAPPAINKIRSSGKDRDVPGGPVVKILPFSAGGWGSAPWLGARIPQASRPKNQNMKWKQYCNKLNKTLQMVHIKKWYWKNKWTSLRIYFWLSHPAERVPPFMLPKRLKCFYSYVRRRLQRGSQGQPWKMFINKATTSGLSCPSHPPGFMSPCQCLSLIMGKYTPPTAEGNGTPLQYSCLENPMDGGAW